MVRIEVSSNFIKRYLSFILIITLVAVFLADFVFPPPQEGKELEVKQMYQLTRMISHV